MDLKKNPNIKVGRVTDSLLARLADTNQTDVLSTDIRNIFDQGCLQYLAARLDITKDSKTGEHPVWDCLVAFIHETLVVNDAASCPTGMSQTRNELLRTMATNNANIWASNIYGDIKKHLIRYLVRIHLRPLSELRHREFKKKKAEERRQRQLACQAKSRVRRKRYWQKLRSLLDQLDRAVDSCARRWSGSSLEILQSVSTHDDDLMDDDDLIDGLSDVTDDDHQDFKALQPRHIRVHKLIRLIQRHRESTPIPVQTNPAELANIDDDGEDDFFTEETDEYDGFAEVLEEEEALAQANETSDQGNNNVNRKKMLLPSEGEFLLVVQCTHRRSVQARAKVQISSTTRGSDVQFAGCK